MANKLWIVLAERDVNIAPFVDQVLWRRPRTKGAKALYWLVSATDEQVVRLRVIKGVMAFEDTSTPEEAMRRVFGDEESWP